MLRIYFRPTFVSNRNETLKSKQNDRVLLECQLQCPKQPSNTLKALLPRTLLWWIPYFRYTKTELCIAAWGINLQPIESKYHVRDPTLLCYTFKISLNREKCLPSVPYNEIRRNAIDSYMFLRALQTPPPGSSTNVRHKNLATCSTGVEARVNEPVFRSWHCFCIVGREFVYLVFAMLRLIFMTFPDYFVKFPSLILLSRECFPLVSSGRLGRY